MLITRRDEMLLNEGTSQLLYVSGPLLQNRDMLLPRTCWVLYTTKERCSLFRLPARLDKAIDDGVSEDRIGEKTTAVIGTCLEIRPQG